MLGQPGRARRRGDSGGSARGAGESAPAAATLGRRDPLRRHRHRHPGRALRPRPADLRRARRRRAGAARRRRWVGAGAPAAQPSGLRGAGRRHPAPELMDERRLVVETLLERLLAQGFEYRTLAERYAPAAAEVEVAVPRGALGRVPRAIARFAQELDLRLVQLERPELRRWRAVLGWADDVGRPWFIAADFLSDYWHGARRYLATEELLAGTSDVRL